MSPAPDFSASELHLSDAPGSVNVRYAYRFPGAKGDGIKLIALDAGFGPHEDLSSLTIVAGQHLQDAAAAAERAHGTGTLGIVVAKRNGSGYNGIAPNATVWAAAVRAGENADIIRACADLLSPGDIIYAPVQRAGPAFVSGAGELDTKGALPFEWWPETYAAIKYATDKGVLYVSAAANGDGSLDLPLYDTPLAGFPADWENPLRRLEADSGSILVGAASPGQPRSADWGTLGSRLAFSNYGAAVDVSAWGREVTYLASFSPEGVVGDWYYEGGSGTSVSVPIVAGCLASLQGALKAAGRPLLTPATARDALRATGLPQRSTPGRPNTERVGNMVDLKGLFDYFGFEAPPLPVINAFVGQPQSVVLGGNTTLVWDVDSADTLSIDPNVGAVLGNSVTVRPEGTTVYILSATNAYGTTTLATTVVVTDFTDPGPPQILTAEPAPEPAPVPTKPQQIALAAFASDDPFLLRYGLAVLGGETNGPEAQEASRLLRDLNEVSNADTAAFYLRALARRLLATIDDLFALYAKSRHDDLLAAIAVVENLGTNAVVRASELERRVLSVYQALTQASGITLPAAELSYGFTAPTQLTPFARNAILRGEGVYEALHAAYALALGGEAPELFSAISELALGVIFARELKTVSLTEPIWAQRFVLPLLATFSSSSKGDLARYNAGMRAIESEHLRTRADQLERREKFGGTL